MASRVRVPFVERVQDRDFAERRHATPGLTLMFAVTHTYGYRQTVCFERARLPAQLTSAIVLAEQLEIAHVSVRVLNLETDVGQDEVAVLEVQTSCPEALTREARHRRPDSCGLSAGGAAVEAGQAGSRASEALKRRARRHALILAATVSRVPSETT